jgi:hypothetical protein
LPAATAAGTIAVGQVAGLFTPKKIASSSAMPMDSETRGLTSAQKS